MLLYYAKKAVFHKMKSLGKRKVLYFCLRLFSRKCAFTRNIWGTVTDHVKFFLNFFHVKSYHKNQVHGSHHAKSNISIKSVIILTCHICIRNLSVVWFLRTYLQSWSKYMRQTLVLVWNSALQEKFTFNFGTFFRLYWQNFHFGRKTRH